MSRLFYFVQPAFEPHGAGNGWEDADLESQASAFWIKGQNLASVFDYTLDGMDETRQGAQAIADAWNQTHGLSADGPTEAESAEIKRVIRTRALPAGAAAQSVDDVLAFALEAAFPNEAAEVGEESQ